MGSHPTSDLGYHLILTSESVYRCMVELLKSSDFFSYDEPNSSHDGDFGEGSTLQIRKFK